MLGRDVLTRAEVRTLHRQSRQRGSLGIVQFEERDAFDPPDQWLCIRRDRFSHCSLPSEHALYKR